MTQEAHLNRFLDHINNERLWRLKEITTLRSMLEDSRSNSHICQTICRAIVPMAYAHWEGYVRSTVQTYINFVKKKGLLLKELSPVYKSLYFSTKYSHFLRNSPFEALSDIVSDIEKNPRKVITIKVKDVIENIGTLNTPFLEKICSKLDLNFGLFSSKHLDFIENDLVGNRHNIAHGKKSNITPDQTQVIVKSVIEIIDIFNNAITDAAETEKYKL